MARKYKVLSADSHLEIAVDRWTPRVPAKYRDRAPRRFKLPDGGDATVVENRPLSLVGLAVTGKPFEEHALTGVSFDDGAGAGSPERRLREQDQDGIDGEVLYTSVGNSLFWRGIGSDEAYLAVVHAYNEFLAEEYCAAAPDRLFALGVIPVTNVDDAVAELEYCAKVGLTGISLDIFPTGKGRPTPEDDRFWAATLDLNMPVTVHVQFFGRQGPAFDYERSPLESDSFGNDPIMELARYAPRTGFLNGIQLVMAGVFDRFPKLKIYFAETMIGWIPHFLEQLDNYWGRHRFWMERDFGVRSLARLPSEYILDHFLWGFLKDRFGVRMRHEIGIHRIMWGSDFPHAATDWPHSRKIIDEIMEGVPEDEKYQMLVGNVVDFFHLNNEA